MTTSGNEPPGNARQRKLNDLFGDEPFLSPTMKARRICDTGTHALVEEVDNADALDGRPDVDPAAPPTAQRLRIVDTTSGDYPQNGTHVAAIPFSGSRSSAPEAAIPLSQAAALLRAELPDDGACSLRSPLWKFRTDILVRWLNHLPKREGAGTAEES
jgi:hypothetical protein